MVFRPMVAVVALVGPARRGEWWFVTATGAVLAELGVTRRQIKKAKFFSSHQSVDQNAPARGATPDAPIELTTSA